AAVTFLLALGKALEKATMNRTRKALSDLVDSAPETATKLHDDGSTETGEVWELMPGEKVLVRNGQQVPVDGRVISGFGGVDEASITGESVPAEKSEGAEVFAGTWLRSGVLRVEATAVGSDSTLAKIIHRVEDAQDDKAKTQTFLERFSKWYTPGVMIAALAVGLITQSVELALTLLVIACPGALVISIPVSIVAGIGRSAKDGVLIKGGEYLETSAKVDAVVVDKTGTLTNGQPEHTDVEVLDPAYTSNEVLQLAARAETASEHPLADAIIRGAKARGLEVEFVESAQPVMGKGIRAQVDGHVVEKPGTLTNGQPELTDVEVLDPAYTSNEVLQLAARAETASEHPLADAIIRGAKARGLEVEFVESAQPVMGKGIRAQVDGHVVAVGSAELLDE